MKKINKNNEIGYYSIQISSNKKTELGQVLNNKLIDGFGIGDNCNKSDSIILYLELDTKGKIDSILDFEGNGLISFKFLKEIKKREYIEPFALC